MYDVHAAPQCGERDDAVEAHLGHFLDFNPSQGSKHGDLLTNVTNVMKSYYFLQ